MPIKWSALKVSEAMDMVEECIDGGADPLERAKLVAVEARRIPNLPQYVDQRLVHLISDIERMDYVKSAIRAVRESLPGGAVEEERKRVESGRQLSFVA